jgi:hypothetical protein
MKPAGAAQFQPYHTYVDHVQAIKTFGAEKIALHTYEEADLVRIRDELKIQAEQIGNEELKALRLNQIDRAYDILPHEIRDAKRDDKVSGLVLLGVGIPVFALWLGLGVHEIFNPQPASGWY